MEQQIKLNQYKKELFEKTIVRLQPNENSQDVELLLKCLVYNITVIGRYT